MGLLKEKIELEVEVAELRAQNLVSRVPRWAVYCVIGCLAASIPAHYAAKAISTVLAKKRFSQYAVTAKASFVAPKPLTVQQPFLTTTGNGIYAAAFPVTNENVDLGLNDVPYEIQALDKNNSVVARVTDKFYILPNETKYAVAPRLSSQVPVVSAKIIFPKTLAWKRNLSTPTIPLIASTPKIFNQTNPVALVLQSTVENKSPYQLGEITIVLLLRDNTGAVTGISQRKEQTMRPFERRTFQQQWPGVYNTDISGADVIAYTNPFDDSNIKVTPQSGNSSGLDRPAPSR